MRLRFGNMFKSAFGFSFKSPSPSPAHLQGTLATHRPSLSPEGSNTEAPASNPLQRSLATFSTGIPKFSNATSPPHSPSEMFNQALRAPQWWSPFYSTSTPCLTPPPPWPCLLPTPTGQQVLTFSGCQLYIILLHLLRSLESSQVGPLTAVRGLEEEPHSSSPQL